MTDRRNTGTSPEPRLVVCYDIKDGRVVKGTSFVDLLDQGDPAELVAGPGAEGADELVLLDIVGAPEGRPKFLKIVERAAAASPVPIAVGGGVRSLDDVAQVLAAGAAKVGINSAVVADPELLSAAAHRFGSGRMVVAIDAKRVQQEPGAPAASRPTAGVSSGFEVYVAGGLKPTGLDAVAWAQECERRGAGEILLTSVDRDGQRSGFELELTEAVASAVNIPVTASGGAGSAQDFVELFGRTGAAAGLAAGMIHDGSATVQQIRSALRAAGLGFPTERSA